MATYPLTLAPSFSYADHLMYNRYTADINQGIRQAASTVVQGQALSTKLTCETLERNAGFLAETITSSTDTITQTLDNLNETMAFGLSEVADGIAGLRADFDIAMGEVISQFEMMRAEMRSGFDHIINILENRRKTDAQEHFRDAMEFYQDGCRFSDKPQWFDDALKHFLAAVEGYERNPLAHQHIGHIYHYQREHQDFEKALHHYRLCYTYAEADEKEYPIAAQGYFYAGWLLRAAVDNDLEEAIKLTEKSLGLDPKLAEAHYHLSKFHGVRGEAKPAIEHLKTAIVDFDRNYCIKASGDPDLDPVRDAINGLFQELKEDARRALGRLDGDFDPKDKVWRQKLNKALAKITVLRERGTYFAYLDALLPAKEYKYLLAEAKEVRHRHYDPAVKAVQEWNEFLQKYVAFDPAVQREHETKLAKAKNFLEQDYYWSYDRALGLAMERPGPSSLIATEGFDGKGHAESVNSVAFSPDGQFVASGGRDGTVRLWDARTGKPVEGFDGKGHAGPVYSVAFSPDGRFIASGSSDRTVRLWDTHTGKLVERFKCKGHPRPVHSVAFSPDGRFIVSGGSDGTLRLWDAHTGKSVEEFDGKGQTGSVDSIAFNPDGQFVASGNSNGTVQLWEIRFQGWIKKDEYERIKAAKRTQEEEKLKAQEQERRKRQGLCLTCGQPIGFWLRLKGNLYCKRHRQ